MKLLVLSLNDIFVFLEQARRILLSTDGPYENVLKIKPPMVFGFNEVDHLVKALRAVLSTELTPAAWKKILSDEDAYASKVLAPRMKLHDENERQIYSSLSLKEQSPATGQAWSVPEPELARTRSML